MNLGHVIALDPTRKQRHALACATGVSRFTYNWALAEWNRQHEAGEKPTAFKLKRQFNAIKREQFPWIMESPRDANSQSFADLGQAFKNFFASCQGARKGKPLEHPTFHHKGKHDAFYVANDKFSLRLRTRGKRGVVRLPVIGDVRTMEPLRWQGKILSGRVYRKAGRWFLSVAVDVPSADRRQTNAPERRPVIGVDLGLKTAVVPSHGGPIDAPKPLRDNLKRLCRANRRLHRRKKGGRNRHKASLIVARLHLAIAFARKDFWQKLTTGLVRENQTIVVEDLGMGFMLKNRRLARAASDVALGMFRPMLAYKAQLHGCNIVVADRNYPSTQRCSRCGEIKRDEQRLGLADRVYVCGNGKCGAVIDRDENAAKNLEQYPGLEGNWRRVPQTSTDDQTSIRTAVARTSMVAEVETNPCEHSRVHTI